MESTDQFAQGAEARLYRGLYLGRPTLMKERFEKKYRHADLDQRLTRDRIRNEARAMLRAKAAGVATPALYLVDLERRSIFMEYIEGACTAKEYIDEHISEKENAEESINTLAESLGTLVARLHLKNIIHGDLTTSNILLKTVDDTSSSNDLSRFVIIDFGLARVESTAEDKAVDLYVLERSLLSAHSEVPNLFDKVLDNYAQQYADKGQRREILTKYKEVRARGRKRDMIG